MKNERYYGRIYIERCASNLCAFIDGMMLSSSNASIPACIEDTLNILEQYHKEVVEAELKTEEKDE